MASTVDPSIDQIFGLSANDVEALSIDPIWCKKKLTSRKGDWELLREWTTDTHATLIEYDRPYINTQIRNLAIWMGLHYKSQNAQADFRTMDEDEVTVDTHKVVVNNIYDIERGRYSKITKNIPQTRVVPRAGEYEDYSGARVGNPVLKTIKEKTKQRVIINTMQRESFIFGESICYNGWNPDKGKIDPRWEKHAERVERLGRGPREMWIDGEKITIDPTNPMLIGVNELGKVLLGDFTRDPRTRRADIEWTFETEYVHIEVLKALYPKKAKRIVATDNAKIFNADYLYVQHLQNHALVYTVHGKSTKFLKDGVRYVCTPDVMLEEPHENPNEFLEECELGNLPYVIMTDIDVPGRSRGFSTIQILASLQHSENQMHTMIKHYLMMLGHPIMLIPDEGNIEIDELSDGSFFCKFSGGFKPELMTPNPVPPQVVAFADMLRDRIQKLGDLQGISTGDIPKSVRAARAIQLLQEIEDLRATSTFEKYVSCYLEHDRRFLSQTKNYKKSDGRLLSILGRGNEYIVEDFDPEVFSRDMRVELEVTGMLPTTPTAKAEFILSAQRESGNTMFTPEKLTKILGFESQQEFIDNATVAVVKADRENDRFYRSLEVEAPFEHDNHLVEWREHLILLQSSNFQMFPKKLKEEVLDHIRTHEMYMWFHMQEHPLYQQMILTTEPLYPAVFKQPRGAVLAPPPDQIFSPPSAATPQGPVNVPQKPPVDPSKASQVGAGAPQPSSPE